MLALTEEIVSTSSNAGRLFAIGDVHGHADQLSRLLAKIQRMHQDTIVMLGDVVNRGPDTKAVIDQLIELQKQCKLICVLGNHEEVMLDAQIDRHARSRWEEMGGFETLMSYGSEGRLKDIPEHHWMFLESFVPYQETDDFAFVHANYDWSLPMSQQSSLMLRWTGIDELPPQPHYSGKTIVCGHTPGETRDLGHVICVDTGCGFDGPLTAIELPSRRLLSS